MRASGIGDRFLGHVERCRVLLHLVDGTGDDPAEAYRVDPQRACRLWPRPAGQAGDRGPLQGRRGAGQPS